MLVAGRVLPPFLQPRDRQIPVASGAVPAAAALLARRPAAG